MKPIPTFDHVGKNTVKLLYIVLIFRVLGIMWLE